jgi:hypothetical protein
MKYALLIAETEGGSSGLESDNYEDVLRRLRESGSFRGARRLAESRLAATVRANGEGTLVSDGPATPGGQQVAAFVIAEFENTERAEIVAIEVAEATGAPVEVRPVAAPGEGGPDAGKEGVQGSTADRAHEFAFLMQLEDANRPWPGEPAFDDLMERCGSVLDRLEAKGAFRGTERLQSSSTARTVRPVAGSKARVVDGPFTEARELIGGFILGECASVAEAVALAALLPGAVTGAVEVREVVR